VVLSEELCILSSCFLSPMSKNCLGGVESQEIGSHPGRDLLKGILKVGNAQIEVGWVK